MSRQDKAEVFRDLHTGPVLVLPNAWDAASARLVEHAGAAAVATTSAGMSWSLGVPDGGRLDRATAIAALTRITRAVQVPVTADIEGGYGDDLAETVRQVLDAGVVGVNIEDSADARLLDVADHAARLVTIRRAADEAGVDLFVNVRTDVYFFGDGTVPSALRRAEAYLAAGADGIFVPGVTDADTVEALAKGIDAPLNVMATPDSPTVAQLAELGVARVSVGQGIAEAAYALTREAATRLLTEGTYLVGGVDYGEMNALLG
ncbi:2-methylisocitrate lyase-like PEP mutase family enzyme [Saccharothrix tamanrassetensis]|uniref:2-methylisocitrate lyase-like PEP mutase family enzyme n=1 Tax=Saccharothrix tamanrassetensis TaxID=1051531 RepID=A0A841CK74_9PSEU|nr:isocitrate lyase/phosphoenolpyruvate mutase family protein [Saccharothrix tamanrassetensis]MBB5957911.1 2-methylisocitrate lyase-like PEP mutase family enzyme [Saccharothrix tamanrassetensis]